MASIHDKDSVQRVASKANAESGQIRETAAACQRDGRHSRRQGEQSVDESSKGGVLRALAAHAPSP